VAVIESAPVETTFACPTCHGATKLVDPSRLECVACGVSYVVDDGIPVFCDSENFYEEYLDEHCPYVAEPPPWKAPILRALPYWSWREWRFFTRHLEPRGAVLDLGCARGKEWFVRRASFVAGVDPTRTVLADCARNYDLVAQAEITRLPFASETFDYVVTSHVIGHIPFEDKDAAFAEIARVLKPGGKSLNIIETDSEHPFARLGKSDPELYVKNFVETDGHVGLELPSELLARFRRHGFDIERVSKMESGLVHLRYYGKYLGQGYPARHPHIRRRIRLWDAISRRPVVLAGYEAAVGVYHRLIEPWRTPLDNAMFVAVSAVKR
jgi:SAM-dependent methyltransferase